MKSPREVREELELGVVVSLTLALSKARAVVVSVENDMLMPDLMKELRELVDEIDGALSGARIFWGTGGEKE
jgi:hypothetical protein